MFFHLPFSTGNLWFVVLNLLNVKLSLYKRVWFFYVGIQVYVDGI
jgi:hypothetical protein